MMREGTVHHRQVRPWLKWIAVFGFGVISSAVAGNGATLRFDIPSQPIASALEVYARQAKVEFLIPYESLAGIVSMRIEGEFDKQTALQMLLKGTGLEAKFGGDGSVQVMRSGSIGQPSADLMRISQAGAVRLNPVNMAAVSAETQETKDAQRRSTSSANDATQEGGIPEVLVKGSKVLNMDIRRTRDDIQPYVTFEREVIENSGAVNLNDFLKQRLTMNTVGQNNVQSAGSQLSGAVSQINLRGMGAGKTLILIDGRRASAPAFNNAINQPNINTIPISAVERIEVLPATSAGIYGGSATAGVINLILRRDYSGLDVKLNYDNTFDSDAASRRVDLATGLSLAGGKTNILLSVSAARSNGMAASDRDFLQRAKSIVLANNPSYVYTPTTPPLGTTANIGSANGTNLVLKNGTALNSQFTFAPLGYAGAASDNGVALVANAGRFNLEDSYTGAVAASPANTGGKKALLQGSELDAVIMTLRQTITPRLDGYLAAMVSDQRGGSQLGISGVYTLPSTAPTNPFQQAIVVRTPNPDFLTQTSNTNKSRTFNAGLIAKAPFGIALSLDYGWSRAGLSFNYPDGYLTTAGTAAINNGTLDILRDPYRYEVDFSPYLAVSQYVIKPFESTVQNGSLRFSKSMLRLPAGELKFSGLLEYRDENLSEGEYYSASASSVLVAIFPERSQSIASGYLETHIPLVSHLNRKPFVYGWDLQLAVRRDEYTVNATTGQYLYTPGVTSPIPVIDRLTTRLASNDYTVGTMYSPFKFLSLRASYGTGFQPPTVNQLLPLAPQAVTAVNGITDPRRGNELVVGSVINGGSPALSPENSTSFTAGAILSFGEREDVRLSLDYVSIKQKGLIGNPTGFSQGYLNYESLFPGRVTRAAVTPGDPYGVGRVTQIDATLVNLGAVDVEAYDFALDWKTDLLPLGTLAVAVAGTYQAGYDVQLVDGTPFRDNVGLGSTNPVRFKGNVGLTWSHANWSVGWNSQYFDSYYTADPLPASNAALILNQGGSGKVDNQLYHDFFARYKFDGQATPRGWVGSLLQGLETQIGIRNVFNTSPPFDAAASGTVFYSPFGDPRLRSYWISLGKSL